jgi:hypothetical protein
MRRSKEDGKAFVIVRNMKWSIRMNYPSDYVHKIRQPGERDAVLGKSIEAFYEIPDISHDEASRVEYERAYRGTAAELTREGH